MAEKPRVGLVYHKRMKVVELKTSPVDGKAMDWNELKRILIKNKVQERNKKLVTARREEKLKSLR